MLFEADFDIYQQAHIKLFLPASVLRTWMAPSSRHAEHNANKTDGVSAAKLPGMAE